VDRNHDALRIWGENAVFCRDGHAPAWHHRAYHDHPKPTLLTRLLRSRCDRGDHDWFPNLPASEFIASQSTCLRRRCKARQVLKPWGECLTGHPLADHYLDDGTCVPTATCAGPR
jgi:hypothetical protein